MLIGGEMFEINISVSLVLEYEMAAKRLLGNLALTERDIDAILDYICAIANWRKVFYLWRPFPKDPKDEMVLELAATANCDFVVTYNKDDFQGVERFGIRAVTPKEFLQELGQLP